MERVRIILAGCGYIAHAEHIPCLLNSKDSDLVAVVEPRPKLREALAERLGVPGFSELGQALDSVECDAVDICARPLAHAALIEQAARAGKHVLCEKPLCHSVSQARGILEVVEQTGVHLMIGYMRRFDDDVLKAKELLDGDKIGAIQSILSLFKLAFRPHFVPVIDPVGEDGAPPPPDPDQPSDLLPSDQIINQSLHHLNLIRFLGGDISEVTGAQMREKGINILLRLEDGALANHCHADGMGNGEEMWVFCEKGSIHCKLWSPHLPYQFPEITLFDSAAGTEQRFLVPRLNPYQREIDAFVELVRDGGENRASGEDALKDLIVIETIHRALEQSSAQSGGENTGVKVTA
jgi:predicted dehydrogenase